jgi:hypothetical protein
VITAEAAARRIAELEAQVAALEAALARRSRELRELQGHLCHRDLVALSRLLTGFPAVERGTYTPDLWQETAAFTAAEVDLTLEDLWQSLLPLGGEGNGGAKS